MFPVSCFQVFIGDVGIAIVVGVCVGVCEATSTRNSIEAIGNNKGVHMYEIMTSESISSPPRQMLLDIVKNAKFIILASSDITSNSSINGNNQNIYPSLDDMSTHGGGVDDDGGGGGGGGVHRIGSNNGSIATFDDNASGLAWGSLDHNDPTVIAARSLSNALAAALSAVKSASAAAANASSGLNGVGRTEERDFCGHSFQLLRKIF